MKNDEFKMAIDALMYKYQENVKQINEYGYKVTTLKVNRLENKLINSFFFSFLSYFIVTLSSFFLVQIIDFSKIAHILPMLLTTSIFGGGVLIEKLLEKKKKFKENLQQFSYSKTEVEKLEEELKYEIELEILKNHNIAIYLAMDHLKGNNSLVEGCNTGEKSNSKIAVQKINNDLHELYKDLDEITTKKVLSGKFLKVIDKFARVNSEFLISVLIGLVMTLLADLPIAIFVSNGYISFTDSISSFISICSPFIVGSLATGGYFMKKSKDMTTVFNHFNSQLWDLGISEVVVYQKKEELERLLKKKIQVIVEKEVQLQKEKSILSDMIVDDDKQDQLKDTKQYVYSYSGVVVDKEVSVKTNDEGSRLVKKKEIKY